MKPTVSVTILLFALLLASPIVGQPPGPTPQLGSELLTPEARDLELTVCDGRSQGLGLAIQPPQAPSGYDVPLTAISVDNTADLRDLLAWSAVQNAAPMDVVLEDGVYAPDDLPDGFLSIHGAHRLWARNLGKAVLRFGIHIGSHANMDLEAGVELHGLRFEIDDESYGAKANPLHTSSAVLTWGQGRNVTIEDSFFDGRGAIDRGIDARQADGLTVRRVVITGFKRFGVFTAASATYGFTTGAVLEDLRVSAIGDNAWARSFNMDHADYDPQYPNFDPADPYVPSQESGIWIGVRAHLARAWVRNIARVGINAAGQTQFAVMEDLDVDQIGWRDSGPNAATGAGLYFDNITEDSVYRRFCVGPDVDKGLTSEWDNYTFPRGLRNLVEDGLIEASWIGINFDHGTVDSHVRNIYFRNATWAGLMMYENVWPTDHESTIEVLYEDIFDLGLPPGSCLVTAYHPSNTTPCDTPPPSPQHPEP